MVYASIVRIQNTQVNANQHQLLATAGGAAGGGLLGSLIGGGRGQTLAEVVGVLAGGAAGHELGKNTVNAVRLTLKVPHKGQYAVLEPAGQYHYHAGEHVEVVSSGNRLNIIPIHNYGDQSQQQQSGNSG